MNVQVGNLKALKNETNIPLVQLLDAPTTVIPGEPTNRVSQPCLCLASPLNSHLNLFGAECSLLAQRQCCAVPLQSDCCAVLLQTLCWAALRCVVLLHIEYCAVLLQT